MEFEITRVDCTFVTFPRKQDSALQANRICMECEILFSGRNRKNINNLSSAELAQKVVNVNVLAETEMVCSHGA